MYQHMRTYSDHVLEDARLALPNALFALLYMGDLIMTDFCGGWIRTRTMAATDTVNVISECTYRTYYDQNQLCTTSLSYVKFQWRIIYMNGKMYYFNCR